MVVGTREAGSWRSLASHLHDKGIHNSKNQQSPPLTIKLQFWPKRANTCPLILKTPHAHLVVYAVIKNRLRATVVKNDQYLNLV